MGERRSEGQGARREARVKKEELRRRTGEQVKAGGGEWGRG
jgi:hypothetical protein